jgi:hypothetical protein
LSGYRGPDEGLEAAVEAEYEAAKARAEAVNRQPGGTSFPPPSRKVIRARLIEQRRQERDEAATSEDRRSTKPPNVRAMTSGVGSGHLGGANRKKHPGIALHEVAHLIGRDKDMSDVVIAAAATAKARSYLSSDVLIAHGWEKGMERRHVPFVRQAIIDRLVVVKGGTIRIRSTMAEGWRPLALDDWTAIPRRVG